MEKALLRTLGLMGIVIFMPLFLFTFADPQFVEDASRSFTEWKLQSEVEKSIDSIEPPELTNLEILLGKRAEEHRAKTESQLEKVKAHLKADAPALVAEQIARLRNLECECRKKWERSLKVYLLAELESLEAARSKLVDFSHVKYMEIVRKLTLDVRIFLAANSIIFIFLFAASFLQPGAAKQLLLPGGLMIISTGICSYFYVFQQNWFYTIIYNDYTGFAYIGYLLLVFAILSDIVFNRARVTTAILNACLQAVGQVANLVPC